MNPLKIAWVAVAVGFVLLLTPALSAQRAEQGPKPVATAGRAMASSSHPEVTRAMLDVLRKGGNAVDAFVTAVILQPVYEPQMSTLAGGMGALIYDAPSGTLLYLDAELDHTGDGAPIGSIMGGAGVTETSGRRIGVPGTVAGLHAAATKLGTLKWGDYFGPAIEAAEEGFPMYSFLYAEMADAALARLTADRTGREHYTPDGFVPAVGERVRWSKLAATLRRLAAEGPEFFYRGEWAQRFVDEVKRTGGRITLKDLERYEVHWREPVRFSYRGHDIVGSPPPATGGALIGMVLGILDQFDLRQMGHYTESPKALAHIRRAFGLAETFVNTLVQDPLSYDVPVEKLLSKPFTSSLAALIRESWPKIDLAANAEPTSARVEGPDPNHTDTNHLVVVDEQGSWASVTHTVYGSTFGTGLVVDGITVNTGNGFPGVSVGRGRRVVAPFPPTFVMREGKPWAALGSPGLSSRAVTIALVNLLGYEMGPYEAVDAPRFEGYQPNQPFRVETRVPDKVREGLKSFGIKVEPTAPYNWHLGSVQLVVRDPKTGRLVGVADPRRAGHAAGYD